MCLCAYVHSRFRVQFNIAVISDLLYDRISSAMEKEQVELISQQVFFPRSSHVVGPSGEVGDPAEHRRDLPVVQLHPVDIVGGASGRRMLASF